MTYEKLKERVDEFIKKWQQNPPKEPEEKQKLIEEADEIQDIIDSKIEPLMELIERVNDLLEELDIIVIEDDIDDDISFDD